MADNVIVPGDKVHIMTRRRFQDDLRRHFAGQVTGVSGELCEVQGYAFVFNSGSNEYRKRPKVRTRVFALGQADHIVNKLAREVDIASLEYRIVDTCLVVTDKKAFSLDINEFGPSS